MRARLVVLALGVVLVGCAPSYRRLRQQVFEPPSRPAELRLSPSEVRHDLALLRHVLGRGYAGRDFVPEASWAKSAAALESLEGRSLTVASLCDGVAAALAELPDALPVAQRRSAEGRERSLWP